MELMPISQMGLYGLLAMMIVYLIFFLLMIFNAFRDTIEINRTHKTRKDKGK